MESQITFSRTNPKLINDSLKEIHLKKNPLKKKWIALHKDKSGCH